MGKIKKTKNSPVMKLRDFHAQMVRSKLGPEISTLSNVKAVNHGFLHNKFGALEDEWSEEELDTTRQFGTPDGHDIISKPLSLADLDVESQDVCSAPPAKLSFEELFPHLVRVQASHGKLPRSEKGKGVNKALGKKGRKGCRSRGSGVEEEDGVVFSHGCSSFGIAEKDEVFSGCLGVQGEIMAAVSSLPSRVVEDVAGVQILNQSTMEGRLGSELKSHILGLNGTCSTVEMGVINTVDGTCSEAKSDCHFVKEVVEGKVDPGKEMSTITKVNSSQQKGLEKLIDDVGPLSADYANCVMGVGRHNVAALTVGAALSVGDQAVGSIISQSVGSLNVNNSVSKSNSNTVGESAAQVSAQPIPECVSGKNSVKNSAWNLLFKESFGSASHENVPKSSVEDRKTPSFSVDFKDNDLNIPLNISSIGRAHWNNSLMGYFVDKFTSFHYVRNWATNLWKDRFVNLLTFDNGFFIFQFKEEVDVMAILEEGPFYCGNRLVILRKWFPGIRMCKEDFSSVPVWIKFFNVPLELWTNEGLGYIASALGKPLFLDEHTFQKSRLNFARVCVEIKADSIIPSSFRVHLGYGEPYVIRVEIPWKPQSCSNCKTFGHSSNRCPLSKCNPVQDRKVPGEKREWVEVSKRKGKGKEVVASIEPRSGKEIEDGASVVGLVPTGGAPGSSGVVKLHKGISAGSEGKSLLEKFQDFQRVRDIAIANLSTKPKKSCLKPSSRPASTSGVG